MNIDGKWMKISEDKCAERYPQAIEFKQVAERGYIIASSLSNSSFHPVWDEGGTFYFENDQIVISDYKDAKNRYSVGWDRGTIQFLSKDGCTITYKKM
ncbi:MAG TPA: hypothetical protein VF540_03360 [Segetibacter sp.]